MSELFQQLQALRQAETDAKAAHDTTRTKLDEARGEVIRMEEEVYQTHAAMNGATRLRERAETEYAAVLAQNAARTAELEAQTRTIEKHQYARRCWDVLTKADPKLYVAEWTVQHPELTWDEIIGLAHRHMFEAVIRTFVTTGCNSTKDEVPSLAKCQAADTTFTVSNHYWNEITRFTVHREKVATYHMHGGGFTIDTTWNDLRNRVMTVQ